VAIFPEGGRTMTGALKPGKPGIGVIVSQTGCRVVPAHIGGTFEVLPPGAKWPRFRRVTVTYGEPLDFSADAAQLEGKVFYQHVSRTVMAKIAELGQVPIPGDGPAKPTHPVVLQPHQQPGLATLSKTRAFFTISTRRKPEDEDVFMSTATPQSEPKLDRDALAAMYEETFRNFEEGTITEGMVVAIGKDKVVVDIGYKSEGMIPADQFSHEELAQLKVGDRLQVYLEECEDADGNLVLSKEKADKMKIWEELEKLHKDEKSIEGKIISRIKGGMMVDIGVKAFLPGSQIDLHPVRDLDSLVGKTFPLKIIKINHRRGNVVVSRRVLLEETRDRRRQTTLSTLKEGQLIQGTVKNITDYGAFIDLGGIDGLLHITDMSWGRVGHPSELFQVSDKVEVTVLKYDRETGRISLGLKQKSADPWTGVAASTRWARVSVVGW
jgi:transcriptional accessory protein Tex/SPT6